MALNSDVRVALGVDNFAPSMRQIAQFDKAIGGIGGGGIGGALAGLGTGALALGAVGVTAVAGLAVGLATAINPALEFGKVISGVGAVSGATADQLAQIQAVALALGQDSTLAGIGASDAARAMEELAKAGIPLGDILGGAARGALLLASAGGTSVENAAALAANAISVFNLHGSDMTHVADLIAGAANASSASVDEFGFAFQQAGAAAALAGQTFDQTAVAIGIMANAGIKGSDAGTSIRTFLNNLIPTTKKQTAAMRSLGLITANGTSAFLNANGSFKDMSQIAGLLHDNLQGLSEAQRQQALEAIFGADAMRAAAIFANAGADGFGALAAQMGNVTAAAVGAKRIDNLAGDLEQLGSSVETARIALGLKLAPALRQVVQWGTKVVNGVIPLLDRGFAALGRVWADFQGVFGGETGSGSVGGELAVGFLLIKDTVTRRVIPAVKLLWSTLRGGGKIDWIALLQKGVMGAVGWVEKLGRWFQIGVDAVVTFKQALAGMWSGTQGGDAFTEMIGRIGLALRDIGLGFQQGGVGAALGRLWTGYLQPALVNAWVGLTGWIGEHAPQIGTQLLAWGRAFGTWAAGVWTDHLAPGIVALWKGFIKWIGDNGPGILTALGSWGQGFADWAGGIWTKNLAPAIAQMWTNFKDALTGAPAVGQPIEDAVGNIIPQQGTNGLIALLGGWIAQLSGWATTTAFPAVAAELTTLIGQISAWVTATGIPAATAAGKSLWDGLTALFAAPPALQMAAPIEDIAGNIVPQNLAGGQNWIIQGLNNAISDALVWIAGPGADALGNVNTALWVILGAKIGPALVGAAIKGIGDHWEEILAALGALIENTTIPGLALNWAPEVGKQIGLQIWAGIKDTPVGAFINWLTHGGGGVPDTNIGPVPGQSTVPGSSPQPGPAPTPMPTTNAPNGLSLMSTGTGGGVVIYQTNHYDSPLTSADVARAHAAELLAAMNEALGGGTGPAPAGTVL